MTPTSQRTAVAEDVPRTRDVPPSPRSRTVSPATARWFAVGALVVVAFAGLLLGLTRRASGAPDIVRTGFVAHGQHETETVRFVPSRDGRATITLTWDDPDARLTLDALPDAERLDADSVRIPVVADDPVELTVRAEAGRGAYTLVATFQDRDEIQDHLSWTDVTDELPGRRHVLIDVLARDVNVDVYPDLLTVPKARARPRLMLSGGDGDPEEDYRETFGRPFSSASRASCAWLAQGFGGWPDLVCATGAPNPVLERWRHGPDHRFEPVSVDLPAGVDVQALLPVDLDEDGFVDVVAIPRSRDGGGADGLVFRGGPQARLTPDPARTLRGAVSNSCATALDVDGDGDTDVVVCARNGLRLYRNDGDSMTRVTWPGGHIRAAAAVAAGDLDGDGYTDLVTARAGELAVRFGDASRLGPPTVLADATDPRDLGIGDVNGDGAPDIVLVNGGTGCATAASAGNADDLVVFVRDRTALAVRTLPSVASGCGRTVTVADLDASGTDDVIVTNALGADDGRLQVLLTDGGRVR